MSKKEITALIIVALLFILGIAGVVVSHETVEPEKPSAARPVPKPRSPSVAGPRIGSGGGGGGAGSHMNSLESLEYRLRLYQTSGTLQKGKIVHSIKGAIAQYEDPLLKILDEETPGIIMPAIDVAGRLDIESPLSSLYSLVASPDPKIRAKAIEAISNRRRWHRVSLQHLLKREKNADVLTAALRAAALIEDTPLKGMLPLLGHDEWRVVRAAQSAMPDQMDEEDLLLVDQFIDKSPSGIAVGAVQVLGGLAPTELRNHSILKHVGSKYWAVQSASLKVLLLSGGKLDDPEPIWKVIEDPATKVTLQVLAFLALEKTQSIDESRCLGVIRRLHPVARLAAARGLVVVKNREGIRILIELLGTKRSKAVTEDDRICAKQCAHEILQEVAHRVIDPKSRLWLPWYRTNEPLPGTPLVSIPRLTW